MLHTVAQGEPKQPHLTAVLLYYAEAAHTVIKTLGCICMCHDCRNERTLLRQQLQRSGTAHTAVWLQELEQELEPKEAQIETLNLQLQEQDGELVEELRRASVTSHARTHVKSH